MAETTVTTGQELGLELCRVLGLDSNKVRGIKIEAEVGHAAVITVKNFIHDSETAEIKECLEKYYLVSSELALKLGLETQGKAVKGN